MSTETDKGAMTDLQVKLGEDIKVWEEQIRAGGLAIAKAQAEIDRYVVNNQRFARLIDQARAMGAR